MWGRAGAEDVTVEVLDLSADSQLLWTITNASGHIEYASQDFMSPDTFIMALEEDKNYRLNLTIDAISEQDTALLLLQVNGAAIMLINADLGLGEFSYPFFTGSKEPVLKIVGGSDASIADFPWQVYFISGDYMCGGTIISKRWIMTAAHCTQDSVGIPIASEKMRVKVGTSTPRYSGNGKWYDVKSYTIHENYSNFTLLFDIAVLELYEDIDFSNAETIELISGQDVQDGATDPGVMSTVSGWGLTGVNSNQSTVLQKVELPIVSNATAASVWGRTSATLLMAGYEDGSKDACNGDSGGPLVVDVGGQMKVAGIVSWGSADCNTYGAFTRVSSYLDWIEEQTGVVPGTSMKKPEGDTEICYGTVVSDYTTSEAMTNTYEWELLPASAGTLRFQNENARITWTPGFLGSVELKVRAEIEGEQTPWAVQNIEVEQNTSLLAFSDDVIVCEGEIASFFVESEGHDLSYFWYKDSVFYQTTSTGSLYFSSVDTLSTGAYYCVVSGSCGELVTGSFNLTVYPNTVIESISERQTVLQDEDVRLSVSSRGRNKIYQWYKDDEPISGATMNYIDLKNVKTTDIGLYHVEVSGTCLSDTSTAVYVYVDTKQSDNVLARVWPSVIKDYFYTAISNNDKYSIAVYNMNAYLIYNKKSTHNQTHIDASAWNSGIYIVEISSGDITKSIRIIKE